MQIKNGKLLIWLIPIVLGLLVIIFIWQPWGYIPDSKDFEATSFVNTVELTSGYVQENQGKIDVVIPETYELLHVVIAIGENKNKNRMIFKNSNYYQKVNEYFAPFQNHPIVTKVSKSLSQSRSNYNRWKNYSGYFLFEGKNIIHDDKHSSPPQDPFKNNLDLFTDFSLKSDYREFYKSHEQFYQNQIENFKAKAPVAKMWTWLENNFSVSYDSLKVVFSPLASSTPHNTMSFAAKGQDFKEAFMFVEGPEPYYNKFTGKKAPGLFNSNLFTEIDHNYINPTTDQHLSEIVKAFRNLYKWNKQKGYSSIPRTFNEYMTWAAFTLFAYDNFDEELFLQARDIQEQIMVKSRGFILYQQFNDKMLELYKNRKPGTTVADLYPDIIQWARSY